MRSIAVILSATGVALALGLWTAWLTVRSPAPIDTISLGVWQAWPNAGTAEVDPYSRARLARNGEIPLGSGEGLMLLAQADERGSPLEGRCDYRIVGQTPPSRLWTVTLETETGSVVPAPDGVAALASDVLLRHPDGSFDITLARTPRAGNWISTESAERFRVVIRLYDTTARTGTALTTLSMPRVVRDRCA